MAGSRYFEDGVEKRYSDIYFARPVNEQKLVWATPALFAMPLYAPVGLLTEYSGECGVLHHNSFYLAVELILSGSLTFSFHGNQQEVGAGRIVILHRDRINGFSTSSSGYFRKMALILSGAQLDFFVKALSLDSCNVLCPMDFQNATARFAALIDLIRAAEAGTERLLSEQVYSLLLYLANEWRSGGGNYPEQVRLALIYMEGNLQHDIRISDIAKAANCSPATLNRLFERHLQTSPGAWLVECRMNFAAQLLVREDLRIKEVASAAGYRDPLNFSTAFRKRFGCPPKQYRSLQWSNNKG